jgi:hypothetical protein
MTTCLVTKPNSSHLSLVEEEDTNKGDEMPIIGEPEEISSLGASPFT